MALAYTSAFSSKLPDFTEYPIERGIVQNWDNVQLLWDKAFESLGVQGHVHERAWIFIEPPRVPKEQRERQTEIAFESYDSLFSLSLSLALSLFLPPPSQTTLEPIVALLMRYSMPAFYLALNTCTSLFSLGIGTRTANHTSTPACPRHPPS